MKKDTVKKKAAPKPTPKPTPKSRSEKRKAACAKRSKK